MYLRYTTLKKDGKVHRYWRLVRSVRVGRRVIQQTVAQLGELNARGRLQVNEIARIQSHDVVLPTATHGEIRLRCVTQPDAPQAALLDRLGIVLPKRMRADDLVPLALTA